MNWRGRISIVAGVLVLGVVAYFLWGWKFGFPPSGTTYYSESTGGLGYSDCLVGIPYNWKCRPTIVSDALGQDANDVENAGDWQAVSHVYPDYPFIPGPKAVFSAPAPPYRHYLHLDSTARGLPPEERQRIVEELKTVLRDPTLSDLPMLVHRVDMRHPVQQVISRPIGDLK